MEMELIELLEKGNGKHANHEEDEEGPTCWDTTDIKFLEVSKDKLTVKYHGPPSGPPNSYNSIRANRPFRQKCMIAYYEVHILSSGAKGTVTVGGVERDYQLNRQPGVEEGSFGYSGEDGKKFLESPRGEAYAETFAASDVIGCGIHFPRQEIFFTKNGKYLGVAFRKTRGNFYPAVGLHTVNESITVNFGQKPFKFDIEAMIAEQREKQMIEIKSIPMHVSDVNSIISNYLLYYGFQNTLQAFQQVSGSTDSSSSKYFASLSNRNKMRNFIMKGEVEDALKFIQDEYSNKSSKMAHQHSIFILQCQLFIELIRRQKVPEAIQHAQTVLAAFRESLNPQEEQYLQAVLGLLAYTDPPNSPLKYLLEVQQREAVADVINRYILSFDENGTSRSVLESLLTQLEVTMNYAQEENGGKGEPFKLSKYI